MFVLHNMLGGRTIIEKLVVVAYVGNSSPFHVPIFEYLQRIIVLARSRGLLPRIEPLWVLFISPPRLLRIITFPHKYFIAIFIYTIVVVYRKFLF
jgi:hypothetical protein